MDSVEGIYKNYCEIKEEIEIDIHEIKEQLKIFDNVILYGAGSSGIAFLQYLRDNEIYPACFADGNDELWGKKCEDLDIIDPNTIVKLFGENILIIITINTDGINYCKSFKEVLRIGGPSVVHKRLAKAGCKNVVEYTYFRRCHAMFRGDNYNLPSCSDVYLMENHMEELVAVYSMLEDEVSRETFLKILEFRLINDSVKVPTFKQATEYFAYDVYKKINNEVFVDCGACIGNTVETFLNNNNYNFEKYYAIEPDTKNLKKLKKYVKNLECKNKIIISDCAAYDNENGITLYELGGPGSFVSPYGNKHVHTAKIDSLVNGERVSFIKMNIEGSEKNALIGAINTIRKYSPVLAIEGYHKTWDIWELPLLIKEINNKYKLYLRSYMNHISFVYYAVPTERCL